MSENEFWPAPFRAAVEQVFGQRINRTTYEVVARRVDHAFKVWRRRYPMNPEQEEYAWDLLRYAVQSVARQLQRSDVEHPYMYARKAIAASMERIVNDPRGHEGFKRRAGTVDVRGQLQEAFA